MTAYFLLGVIAVAFVWRALSGESWEWIYDELQDFDSQDRKYLAIAILFWPLTVAFAVWEYRMKKRLDKRNRG